MDNIYKVNGYVVCKVDGQLREKNRNVIFRADSLSDAVTSAAAWAKRMIKQYQEFNEDPDAYLCAINVNHFLIYNITEDGFCDTGCCNRFFEWKIDYPGGGLDNNVEYFQRKEAKESNGKKA